MSQGIPPAISIRSRCQVCHRVLACPSSTLVALARIAGNGVRTIVVQTANHFARDLMVQEVGFAMLRDLGVTLIAADNPSSFLDDGPTSKLIRQILGAVSKLLSVSVLASVANVRLSASTICARSAAHSSYCWLHQAPALMPHEAPPAKSRRAISL